MPVDAVTAEWLRGDGHVAIADHAPAAAWGDRAIESAITSPVALTADASAEAARQVAFLGPARALDLIWVPGRQHALIGKSVSITADAAGYSAGRTVFVVDAAELEDGGTMLKVVTRLAP